ncbi:MAG TPA: 2-dehydropantoate 2-reductase [Stellaceae bacterium]|nr:2-dehydropantoate 2-reductase [Stellaceae bacterium]
MKICVYGAGAIGGYVAVQLARSGVETSVVARGPHLAAIKESGLTLKIAGETHNVKLAASDDAATLGRQDYVIVTLKAHQIAGVAPQIRTLCGPDTAILYAVNGVPWWYFYKLAGPYENRRVPSVDRGNAIWDNLGPERALGCVVLPAAELVAPAVIEHRDSDRFPIGEPDGSKSARIAALSQAMIKAGLRAPVRARIRDEIWVKLWGNLAFNPVSALTGLTLAAIAADSDLRALVRAAMLEGQRVGEALGVNFAVDVDRRIAGSAEVGEHKTSMLQDLERGRPMEIDPMVTAVAELGDLTGIETPTIDAILALVRQRARAAGCY